MANKLLLLLPPFIHLLLSLLIFSPTTISAAKTSPPSVVIVGGGITGAATSYFLSSSSSSQKDGVGFDITLVESENRLGGRIYQKDWSPELGASVFHAVNKYMKTFVTDVLNFTTTTPYDSDNITLGLWHRDKHKVMFETHSNKYVTIAKSLYRYGFDAYRMIGARESLVSKLLAVYDLLEDDASSFESVIDLFDALNLTESLYMGLEEHLQHHGVSRDGIFTKEFVRALCRINYGQTETMSAFAGSVAMKGSGNELFSAAPGNMKIVEGLINASRANVKLSSRVVHVGPGGKKKKGTYCITLQSGEIIDNVDAVVFAVPLHALQQQHKGITFDPALGVSENFISNSEESFVTTHVTMVAGQRSDEYADLPGAMITVDDDSTGGFRSFGRAKKTFFNNATTLHLPIHKIFSDTPLSDDDDLGRTYFKAGTIAGVVRHTWPAAYPRLSPRDRVRDKETSYAALQFRLPTSSSSSTRLYFPNAMEFAASTMETQCIAAKAVSRMVCKDLVRSGFTDNANHQSQHGDEISKSEEL